MPFFLGLPRGAPLFAALQPFDRACARLGPALSPVLFWIWLPIIGFAPVMILAMKAISLLYQFWIHTELVGSVGPLEKVFKHTVAPSRPSWFESSLHRPQSRRHADHLGQTLRLV